jgi:hypothetical protein
MTLDPVNISDLIQELGNLHLQVMQRDRHIAKLEKEIFDLTTALAKSGESHGSGLSQPQADPAAGAAGG